jgi:hypothetical protein
MFILFYGGEPLFYLKQNILPQPIYVINSRHLLQPAYYGIRKYYFK